MFNKTLSKILVISLWLTLTILQLHNIAVYPLDRGFDATAHIEHINYVKANWRLPAVDSGWEMFQPPLYYWLAALLPSLMATRMLGLFAWLLIIYLARQTTLIITKKTDQSNWLALLAAALPINLYLTPAISNEYFSAGLITLSLYLFWRYPSKHTFDKAAVLGLAFLSKATAVLIWPADLLENLINRQLSRHKVQKLLSVLMIALLLGGWFYIKNLVEYGKPFYQPADYIPLANYAQTIVPRNLNFFLNPSSLFKLQLMTAHYQHFLGGTLFSWFYDGHGVLLPVQEGSKAGSLIVVMGLGWLILALRGVWQEVRQGRVSIFFSYSLLLIGSYIAYNFKLPIYSTVKGAFLTSLILPFVYYLSLSLKDLKQSLWLLMKLGIVSYVLVIARHFWVLGWWY